MSSRPYALDGLRTSFLGRRAFRVECTRSTQDDLRALLDRGEGDGALVWADHQIAGRGTRGRAWFSLPDPQLLVSFAIRSDRLPSSWPLLNIGLGIAVAVALQRMGVSRVGIKWPNDVTLERKKVAGLLSEIHSVGNEPYALVGLGLNHRGDPRSFPVEFRAGATVLSEHLFPLPSIETLLVELLDEIETTLEIAKQSPASIQEGFEALWIYKDLPISVDDGAQVLRGRAQGIRKDGALLLKTEAGLVPVLSGTVRPTSSSVDI